MKTSRGTVGMLRRRILVVASILMLAGCGSAAGVDEPTAEPSSTEPPPVYTLDELTSALPDVTDVPTGVKEIGRCPGDDSCKDAVSVSIQLIPDMSDTDASAADAEGAEKASHINDYVFVSARTHDDAAAALAYVDDSRTDAEKFEGDFDFAAEETENGFIPGEIGSGAIEPASLDGWDGVIAYRTATWTAPAGDDVFKNDGEVDHVTLTLSRGASSFRVLVTVRAELRDKGSARAIASQVAEEYIARLG